MAAHTPQSTERISVPKKATTPRATLAVAWR